MKANRKTMLGVALAVAIVALAGIGYAAAGGYTATTKSTDNDLTTVYNTITLSAASGNAYTTFMNASGIEFNTENTAGTQKWYVDDKDVKMTYNSGAADGSKYALSGDTNTAVKVSQDLTVTVDASKGDVGKLYLKVNKTFSLGTYTFVIKADDKFFAMNNFVGEGNGVEIDTFAKAAGQTTTISVYLYIGETDAGFTNMNAAVLSDVEFTFTAVQEATS